MKKLLLSFAALFVAAQVNAQACSGAPAANTVVASSTNICAGNTVTLSLQNAYTATGIVYQWASSTTSQVGPWSQISGANNSSLVTNAITQSGWYTVVIACSNSFMTTTATPVYINVGATGQTATIPYYEGFESLTAGGLPNCSWSASALGTNCLGFNTPFPGALACSGIGRMAFSYSATALGSYEFYSQGLVLSAGVTYSAALWQQDGSSTANNWSNFGIGVGSAQAAAGSTVVYNTAAPTTSVCTLRSGTFTVPSNGTYYLRIYATAVSGANVAQYLVFDALSVTIPCTISQNAASAIVSPASGTICAGDSLLINFTPAANCSMTGVGNSTYAKANTSTNFTFTTTNNLTGCTATVPFLLLVNPSPVIIGFANPPIICAGATAQISMPFSQSFTLSPGAGSGTSVIVSPTVTTVYTLSLINNTNTCINPSTVQVSVNQNPTVTVFPTSNTVCRGDSVTIQGSGAATYDVSGVVSGSQIALPTTITSTVYTIVGSSAANCKANAQYTLTVEECLGFESFEQDLQVQVYPNPTKDKITVQCDNALQLSLITVDGKLVVTQEVDASSSTIDLKNLEAGIYFLQVQSTTQRKTLRVLKE